MSWVDFFQKINKQVGTFIPDSRVDMHSFLYVLKAAILYARQSILSFNQR